MPVAGLAPAGTTRAEARLVPLTPGQGVATPWQSLTMLVGNAAFRGEVRATGGWYQLQVRAKAGFAVLTQATVNRVGVGEVFVVAGQSNALGVFEVSYDATDDRVSCIDSRQDDPAEQMLGLPFSHAGAKTNFAPANPPHIWTMLGDSLTRRLNVPVLFLGAAQGGSSSFQWAQTAVGIGPGGLSPYRRLGVALRHYVARTGLRAVLWHQGESDNLASTSEQTYEANIGAVIQKAREQTGFANLPWVIARASYISNKIRPAVVQAQNDLIATVDDVWPGPITDTCVGPMMRPDGLHFGGLEGLTMLTQLWNQSLTDAFFGSAAPFQPDSSALLTTGYVMPLLHRPGDTILVPFVQEAPLLPGNTFRVQLAATANGTILAESPPTTGKNPIPLVLPTTLPTGAYRVRVRTSEPVFTSTWSEPFRVDVNTARVLSQTAPAPFVVGGQPDPAIQRIGYLYDAPAHGFDALVWANVAVEIRLERLDGGPFAETNWGSAATTTVFPSFTHSRKYPPQAMGVGGVEMGRYRLSVRRQGSSGPGMWVEGTFIDKRHTVYIGNEPAPIPATLPDQADVSLLMQVNKRVVSVGDVVRYTVQLTNNGPDDATNIRLIDRLPDALQFVASASDGLVGSSRLVSASVAGLQPGDKQVFLFDATVTAPGQIENAAEVLALDQADPNSLPGSGTADGENDMAVADCRTPDNSSARWSSPNPNGRLLPPVASNQPMPNPATTDLSLSAQLSKRVVNSGDTVLVHLQLVNAGGQSASAINVQLSLPTGWQLIPSPGLTQSGQVVTATVSSLSSGQSVLVPVLLRAGGAAGSFQLTSQVSQATGADADSTPGNGSLRRGEDDEAVVDGRMR